MNILATGTSCEYVGFSASSSLRDDAKRPHTMGNAQAMPAPPPPPTFADTVGIAAEKSWGLLLVIFLAYAAISLGLRAVIGTTRPRRASEIAQSGQAGSPLADILAYHIVALGYAMGTAYIGTAAWFDGSAEAIGSSLQDRMYAFSRPMELLGIATAAYEFFNVVCAIMLPEYREQRRELRIPSILNASTL